VGDYSYIEIGSHLRGSLLPHLAGPACTRISSVDLRPEVLRDEGRKFASFFLPGILYGIAFGKLRKRAKKALGPLAHDPEQPGATFRNGSPSTCRRPEPLVFHMTRPLARARPRA
jgi:hypothetical protein